MDYQVSYCTDEIIAARKLGKIDCVKKMHLYNEERVEEVKQKINEAGFKVLGSFKDYIIMSTE